MPFQGTAEFTRALPLFAVEATTLRYASDHVDVEWYPSGSHIVEQNEPGAKLYLILSGYTDVIFVVLDAMLKNVFEPGPTHGALRMRWHLQAQAEPRQHRPAVQAIDVLAASGLSDPARYTSTIPQTSVGMRLGKRGA